MRILHACNYHRGGGGLDNAFNATVRLSKERGLETVLFLRDSKALPPGLGGKVRAFAGGIHGGRSVRRFEETLAEFQPDVVHVHELYPLISPWILPKCTAARVPVVMTCYDFRLSCPVATHFSHGEICERCPQRGEHWAVIRNCRGNLAESLAFATRGAVARRFGLFSKHVSHFIVPSDFSEQWLMRSIDVPVERVTINYPIVTAPEEAVHDPALGRYFGYAGRFVPEKGVELLIDAARSAGVPIRFAANASSHPAVREGDDAGFVLTHGPEELAEFYRGCRALVMPSIWYETFGLVAAEAMSHGVPAICARLGALPGTLRDGEAGLLFAPGDRDELAEKLKLLWNDADLCRRLGSAARQTALEQWSEDAHFERLMQVYSGVVG